MTPAQLALVRLMQRDFVSEWRQIFQGTMIRATTSEGRQAFATREEVDGLVDAGVLAWCPPHSYYLTSKGRGL